MGCGDEPEGCNGSVQRTPRRSLHAAAQGRMIKPPRKRDKKHKESWTAKQLRYAKKAANNDASFINAVL
jgi:hypothetical protein